MKRTAVLVATGVAVFLALVFLVSPNMVAQFSTLISGLHPQLIDLPSVALP